MSARQPHIALVLTYRTLSRPIHGHAFRLYWTTKTKYMPMAITKPNEKAKRRARLGLALGCLSLRSIIIVSTPSILSLIGVGVGVGVGVAPRHYTKNTHNIIIEFCWARPCPTKLNNYIMCIFIIITKKI